VDNGSDKLTIAEAAEKLGISQDALRKRIRRGLVQAIKVDKKWFVVLDNGVQDGVDRSKPKNIDTERLIVRFESEVQFLRTQLSVKDEQLAGKDGQINKLHEELDRLTTDIEAWREQVRYKELQIAQLQDRMIQLPSPEEPELTEQGSEVREPAAAQEVSGNVLSQFWRWFVGGD
jgi:hypothetical protein